MITLIVAWGRTAPRAWVGQVATDSLVNLREFKVLNIPETERRQTDARKNAPRYYRADGAVLEELRAKVAGLPVAVRSVLVLEDVEQELRRRFELTDASLTILQRYAGTEGPDPTASWREWTEEFIRALWRDEPLLEPQEFQKFSTVASRRVMPPIRRAIPALAEETVVSATTTEPVATTPPTIDEEANLGPTELEPVESVEISRAIDLVPDDLRGSVRSSVVRVARFAGFPRDAAEIVAAAIVTRPAPTVLFDLDASREAADLAAARIPAVEVLHPAGEVIYARGDVITPEMITTAAQALEHAFAHGGLEGAWGRVPGWLLLAAVVVTLLAGHAVIFYPRIARSTTRLSVVVLLLVVATGLGTMFAVSFPPLSTFGVAISIALLAIALTLAYDRRLAIFAAVLASISLTVSTGAAPVSSIAMLATGATFAALLASIPSRGAFVRATVVAGSVTAVVFLAAGLAITPLGSDGAWKQMASNGLFAGAGSLTAGFVMLGIMPTIERLFDITTGLSLAELRDTRQPLLRELQARAPGTYNHSLAVASIAENAAEAIGADSRLVYVGGLYHDVGKLNKPEYFIENQGGGDNKHDKLSPAMSLLVIVGHVKDGLELAQEYNLPKVLRHFIESHHGTSLVEYFFHAARERAADEGEEVEEFSYRYPGPKPRTREAAILLICDGIESATRAMSDPTPSRIEALVRRMSRARLQDGQLDDSDLTFRELRVIEDSIIKSLCAIYHSRIAYPGGREEKDRDREVRSTTATVSG
jgi:putative nucleotidyltransferase with HDIG domain